jgi:4-hydroxybenzoate polyprenyltransferase
MDSRVSMKLSAVSDLIRLPKQYGTLLLLFPSLWSLILAAKGIPPWPLIMVFVLGAFLMRSAGCVINDIVDRDFDRRVHRTKDRPVASGRLTTGEAIGVFVLLVALAAPLMLLLSPLAILLTPFGLMLAVLYPFTKRLFSLPQAVLGIAFGWGALMAWASIRNEIGLPGLLIFLTTIFWATAYDTIYALMDKEDDLRTGIKSAAILFGDYAWLAVGLSYLSAVACLAGLGRMSSLGEFYWFSLIIVSIVFGYHSYKIRKGVNHTQAFSLFKSNVMIGFILLLGILFDLGFG